MKQEKKLVIAKWIAAGCVLLALLCAVAILQENREMQQPVTNHQLQMSRPQQSRPQTNQMIQKPTADNPTEQVSEETSEEASEVFSEESQEETAVEAVPEYTVETVQVNQEETEEDPTVASVEPEFPYTMDEGRLVAHGLFQYTGMNPDAMDQFGENVAGLVIENTSGMHLEEACITLYCLDGEAVEFWIADLPAGETAMVFSAENQSAQEDAWQEIFADASFETETPLLAQQIQIDVNGTAVTLTNLTDHDLQGLRVWCHCVLGTEYFGGTTYDYPVDLLPSGGSVQIDAWQCYLDRAEVVRIELEKAGE